METRIETVQHYRGRDNFFFLRFSMHSDLLEVSDVIILVIPNILVQVLRELPVGSWQH